VIITKMHLSRRFVLRGLGAALALPVLDGMIPALTAQAKTAAAPVRRLGVFYVPNGMSMPYWFPKTEGPLKELPPTLRSLAAFKDRVLLCGGLADEPANRVRGGGDHARSAGTFLTGVAFKLTSGADVFGSVSMDQIVAKQLAKETQLGSLELGIESNAMLGSCDGGASCAYTNTVAWANETTPLPIENDPRAVFERLFGTSGSTDRGARLARIEQDRSILDFVSEQVAGLKMRIGPNDKARLTEYLDSIRDVERRIQMAEHQNSRELPVVEQPIGIPSDYAEHAKLMMDMLALSYQTDLTRVSTFMLAKELSGRSYPEVGVSEGHHALSHHGDSPEKIALLAKVNAHHTSMLAYFLEKLQATPDGDGSLLDHTLLLYGSGHGDPNKHDPKELPIIVVGSDQLKGGQHYRFPHAQLANLHVSLLNTLGMPVEKFGDVNGRLPLEPLSV
jgi:Protein of unknown function (DUF1552)